MHPSGIYNRFLQGEGNVRVFSTEKNTKPIEITKKVLRKAYPFLIASALAVSGCSFETYGMQPNYSTKTTVITPDSVKHKPLDEIADFYDAVPSLRENEALSEEFINEILSCENLPVLTDFNYNHMPENNDNYWAIVRNGVNICLNKVQDSYRLTTTQKSMYKAMANKMLHKVSKVKGTECEVDLSDYNNLKTFLFFEKVIKYEDDYERVIQQKVGQIDEKSEILGRYYEDYERFYNMASKEESIVNFSRALYFSEAQRGMLDIRDSTLYNRESLNLLDEWMDKQNITDEGIYRMSSIEDSAYCNSAAFYYKRGKDLRIKLDIDENGSLGNDLYAPVGDIVIHELMHVMQRKPSSAEFSEHNNLSQSEVSGVKFEMYEGYIDEIGPILMSISIDDYLYKKVHNIDQNSVVDYGDFTINGKKIKIGELAMWFRSKLEKSPEYNSGEFSVDKILASPLVFNELKQISNGYMPNNQLVDAGMSR